MCSTWYLHREHLHVGGIRLPLSGNNGLDTVRRTATRRRRREGSCYNEIHCCKTPPFAIYHAHLQKYLSRSWVEAPSKCQALLYDTSGPTFPSDRVLRLMKLARTGFLPDTRRCPTVMSKCVGRATAPDTGSEGTLCLYLLQLLLLSFLFSTRSWLLQTQKFSPVC